MKALVVKQSSSIESSKESPRANLTYLTYADNDFPVIACISMSQQDARKALELGEKLNQSLFEGGIVKEKLFSLDCNVFVDHGKLDISISDSTNDISFDNPDDTEVLKGMCDWFRGSVGIVTVASAENGGGLSIAIDSDDFSGSSFIHFSGDTLRRIALGPEKKNDGHPEEDVELQDVEVV